MHISDMDIDAAHMQKKLGQVKTSVSKQLKIVKNDSKVLNSDLHSQSHTPFQKSSHSKSNQNRTMNIESQEKWQKSSK